MTTNDEKGPTLDSKIGLAAAYCRHAQGFPIWRVARLFHVDERVLSKVLSAFAVPVIVTSEEM
jgi:hypothetical protein